MYSERDSRTQPASATSMPRERIREKLPAQKKAPVPDTGSNERTSDIPLSVITTSSLTGTLPPVAKRSVLLLLEQTKDEPTSPVLPPCGTTPIRRSQQCFIIRLTSSVDRGFKTTRDWPLYLPIQSLLNWSKSELSAAFAPSVDITDCGARKDWKCTTSASVGVVNE